MVDTMNRFAVFMGGKKNELNPLFFEEDDGKVWLVAEIHDPIAGPLVLCGVKTFGSWTGDELADHIHAKDAGVIGLGIIDLERDITQSKHWEEGDNHVMAIPMEANYRYWHLDPKMDRPTDERLSNSKFSMLGQMIGNMMNTKETA